jgi:hypothetical protein
MVEGLGKALKAAVASNNIKGLIFFGDDLLISHQQFIDDTMLMGVPFICESKTIKKVLFDFMDASSTSMNQGKSQLFFFNTSHVVHGHISRILGFQRSSLVFKYLGVPLIENILCNSSWENLLSNMDQKLVHWSFRSLNTLWRLILLKSIMQAMPLYLFFALAAPKFHSKSCSQSSKNLPLGRGSQRKKVVFGSLGQTLSTQTH